jgi:hypothetical protein
MPPKIRELIADLRAAVFLHRRGEGSHRQAGDSIENPRR